MSKAFSQRFYLSFLVSVSIFGLCLVILVMVFPLSIQEDFQWRKPLIGSVFGLICFLGMMAVFFPDRCSTIFQTDDIEESNHVVLMKDDKAFHKISSILGVEVTHGHHPSCEGFAVHEFQVGNRTFCAACMGLLFGALMALFGVATYFFLGWDIGGNVFLFLFLGVSGVGLGLFQYVFFDVRWRLVRFLLNAFFVFGAFLVLAGLDATASSVVLDFFVVLLCVFWLFTRILLSKHVHSNICKYCGSKCEGYREIG